MELLGTIFGRKSFFVFFTLLYVLISRLCSNDLWPLKQPAKRNQCGQNRHYPPSGGHGRSSIMDLFFSETRHGLRKAWDCNRHLARVGGESRCRFRRDGRGGVEFPCRVGLCLLGPDFFVGTRRVGAVHPPRAGFGHIVVGGVEAAGRG